MKTINIFIASSAELEDDRNAFGNLVRRLNKSYERRGIHLELFEWEDYDAAYNGRRKQDEYNEQIRVCDMFLAVFHRVAGKYTIEEFNLATEEYTKRNLPKIYVYCKALGNGDVETDELKKFKHHLLEELGHFFSNYANRDTMQLHFVMQLQQIESSISAELKVEDGFVTIDGQAVARMENLPFAGLNEDFQRMSKRLAQLPDEIANFRKLNEQMPGQEFIQSKLQELLNEYNKLKDDFTEYQKNLLNTAQRVAQLQGSMVTERLRRAVAAFNEGKIREANIILDEAERDGELALERYRATRELAELERQNVVKSIEEILFKTSTIMVDASIDIAERVSKVQELYEQADKMAIEIEFDKIKYDYLLLKYADFLSFYDINDKAIEIYKRIITLREDIYGAESEEIANIYNAIGMTYCDAGHEMSAFELLFKAKAIHEKLFGLAHRSTATTYYNIGRVYHNLCYYNEALEYYIKSLTIIEGFISTGDLLYATIYNNIGNTYKALRDYSNAFEYCNKALAIREGILGLDHPHVAECHSSIGGIYYRQKEYSMALEHYHKALEIRKETLGILHSDTLTTYDNIGRVYQRIGDKDSALRYYLSALSFREKKLGVETDEIAFYYREMGYIYDIYGDYDKTLECLFKVLSIHKKHYGVNNLYVAKDQIDIGVIFHKIGEYEKALEHSLNGLIIHEKKLGNCDPSTINSYNNVGACFRDLGEYDKALEYYFKALESLENTLGVEHPDTKKIREHIEEVKAKQAK